MNKFVSRLKVIRAYEQKTNVGNELAQVGELPVLMEEKKHETISETSIIIYDGALFVQLRGASWNSQRDTRMGPVSKRPNYNR